RFDDQIRDIFAALKFLSEEFKKHPADLDNVFLAGDSAGGHFSCVTTAVNINEEMQKDFGVTYCGLDFKAVAAICPAVDLLSPNLVMNINVPVLLGEKHRKSKYRKYLDVAQIISSDFPPYYVNTASADFLRKQCYRLKELLDTYKIEHKFHDFTEKENDKNLTHVFNVVNPFSPAGDQANTEIADFFKARMRTKV
ncbi:MAG: alpha/beta hydrolase, partial [Clostridia bacterium]|nr:alpha/beta hydrolase [Clostridia bacterium]